MTPMTFIRGKRAAEFGTIEIAYLSYSTIRLPNDFFIRQNPPFKHRLVKMRYFLPYELPFNNALFSSF